MTDLHFELPADIRSQYCFAAVRNRIRMHQQRESLSRIINNAGILLRSATLCGDENTAFELREIVASATFMMSAINFLLSDADRNELEHDDVAELIARAESMTDIMNSAFFH